MALIAPLAGAALGGIATGGATWAMSAGWLIGSWLFQKDNDEDNRIFDSGAEEMPRFNQALRGTTVRVSFGTNRVSSHVVWTNDFTTIRHESTESQGGGKGGGSGMGAKGGGPSSTNVTYEYKWDLLFHCGMSDEDVSLFGGWLGSERLEDETLLAIINNSNSGFGSFFRSNVGRPQNATLTFDEGFYHGALATNDPIAENWAHYESVVGEPHRWPYTYYIGFKQLNLGGNAVVPQLTWEIGPGDLDLTFTGGHIDYWNSHSITPTTGSGPAAGMIIGQDGDRYQLDFSEGNTVIRVRNITTGVTTDTLTDTEFDTLATAVGLDPTNAYVFDIRNSSCLIPGTNKFLLMGQDLTIGFSSRWAVVLAEIDSNGAISGLGGLLSNSNSLEAMQDNGPVCGIFGEGTDDDKLMVISNSFVGGDDELMLYEFPSINDMNGLILEDTTGTWDLRRTSLRSAVTEIQENFGDHESYRKSIKESFGFIVPVVTVTGGIPSWSSRIYWYIGKSDIEWHLDNPANINGTDTIYDITGTHPNGGLFYTTVTDSGGFSVTNEFVDDEANWIDRSTELSVIPLADSGFLYDETTVEDASDYDPRPQVHHLKSGTAAGATLVIFWKNLAPGSVDRGDTNASTQARVFIWNPLTQISKLYGSEIGAFADTDADWGIGTGAYTMNGVSGFYDESAGEILIGGYVNGGGATNDIFAATFGTFNIGGGEDVCPPYIIRKILTSSVFGMGIPSSAINQSSYELALQYCEAQCFKVSVQYNREETYLRVIAELLDLYGGYLIDSGGVIKFGLGAQFTPISSVTRTIDNDHLLVDKNDAPVRITRGARQDTFNNVKVNYFDRDLEYRQNFVEIGDEVDQDLYGVRAQEFPAKFVMKEKMAAKLAARGLWSNLYAKDMFDFKLGPKDADLEPGDVVTLVDSHHIELQTGKQVRIVVWVENEPMKFSVRGIEEVEYISNSDGDVNSQQAATQNNLFGPARPPADFTMYELPQEFQGANAQVYAAYRQQGPAMGARLYTSADGVSFAVTQDAQPFIISGIMADALPLRDPGHVEENVEVHIMPDTISGNFSVNSFVYAQTFQLDDVQANGRALGAGLMWINSEMMAYEGVKLLGQNNYRFDKVYRGWGGTHIQGHTSGDTWYKHGGGIFAQTYNEDKIGSIIHFKIVPYNFAGVEYNVSSVDARTYQIQGTYFRPQVPAPIRTFVQSPGSFLTIQSEDLGIIAKKNVIAGGSDVQFEWPDAARQRGYGSRGYGTGGYGRFAVDITSHGYRIEVLSNDLSTVVRCTTVDTTAFEYTHLVNSEDFNGWSGGFGLRVTPFNEFGDALRNRTKILELFI